MMKKILCYAIILTVMVSMTACGANNKESQSANETTVAESVPESSTIETTTAAPTEMETTISAEEQQMQKDMDELSAIGDIEVKNGLLTVALTFPADLAGEITQEQLDKQIGDTCVDAKLNEDGSVTYKLTKAQYQEMLAGMKESMEEGFQELIDDDENYSITDIKYNDDLSVYDVTIDAEEIGFGDSFATFLFYMYTGMYDIFTGKKTEHVIVNFYNEEGGLLDSFDSANMQDEGETETS